MAFFASVGNSILSAFAGKIKTERDLVRAVASGDEKLLKRFIEEKSK
jgi:hypothetical protein